MTAPHPAPHLIAVGRVTAYELATAETGLQGALSDLHAEYQRVWFDRADARGHVRSAVAAVRRAKAARSAYILALGAAYETQRHLAMRRAA